MSFTQSIRTCLSKYVTFSGRASRAEYWWFFLFLMLVGVVTSIIDAALFSSPPIEGSAGVTYESGPVNGIAGLALMLPHLAAAVRRMHDTGRSGWFVVLPLLLMIGAGATLVFGVGVASLFDAGGSMDLLFTRATLIVVIPTLIVLMVSPLIVLFMMLRPSQAGSNAYGPNPHEGAIP